MFSPRSAFRREASSTSRLELLPAEILEKIFACLPRSCSLETSIYMRDHLPISSNAHEETVADLLSCLLTSQRLYCTAIRALYNHPKIGNLKSLEAFMNIVSDVPELRGFIHHLDLSGIGDSISSSCLKELTTLLPALVGFKYTYPKTRSGSERVEPSWNSLSKLARLEIGYSTSDRIEDEDFLRPGLEDLGRLKVLGLGNSTISAQELGTISTFSRLTSLTVSVGQDLWPFQLARLLDSHPSLKDSLTSLRIEGIDHYVDVDNTTAILASVPDSVRSLDLAQWQMSADHVLRLRQLCTRLEELRVGPNLQISDLEQIILHPNWKFEPLDQQSYFDNLSNENPKMEPILRAANRCRLRQRINSITWESDEASPVPSPLRFLGIAAIHGLQQACLEQSVLLAKNITCLEVIETSADIYRWKTVIGEGYRTEGWRTEQNFWNTWVIRK